MAGFKPRPKKSLREKALLEFGFKLSYFGFKFHNNRTKDIDIIEMYGRIWTQYLHK